MDKKNDLTNGYNCVMLVTKQARDCKLNCEQKNWDKFQFAHDKISVTSLPRLPPRARLSTPAQR